MPSKAQEDRVKAAKPWLPVLLVIGPAIAGVLGILGAVAVLLAFHAGGGGIAR